MKILRDPQILSGYLIEQPFASLPAVTHCGEAVCVRGHHLAVHRHPVFEFLVLVRGHASWAIEGHEHKQNVGDILVVLPDQPHATGRRHNPENQHLWIGVDLPQLGPAGKRLARELGRIRRPLLPGGTELEPLLRGLIAQAIARKPRAADIARCYLQTLVAILLQRVDEPSSPTPSAQAPCSLPIQRCLAYMESHLTERLSLSDLARVAAIQSAAHFCTRFRRETGIPPAGMHLRLRLNAAKEALTRPEAGVTRVAMQFGFSSSQHFSGKFKQAFGLTPRAWLAVLARQAAGGAEK